MNSIARAVRASGRKDIYVATHLGLAQTPFSDRMRGRTPFTLAEAIKIARLLDISLDELVGDDDLPCGFVPIDEAEVPA